MITDFHTHILPEIDDGSSSVEESLEMLKTLAEQGIERIVCTPHFYANHTSLERFLSKREKVFNRLIESREEEKFPELILGAEVLYFRGISEWEGLKELKIQGTDCVLIEMPMEKWTDTMFNELATIYYRQGLVPIVAHIDRYIAPFKTYGIPKRLEEMNVYVQANSSFFTNRFTSSMAMKMLKNGQIHLIGSDCHNMTDRKPDLISAVERIIHKTDIDIIRNIETLENGIFNVL